MSDVAKETFSLDVLAQVPGLHGIERRSVRDIVCEKLALLVASGVLQTGDHLPGERELASAFGVSRESVRGAVQTLALQGIVDVSQGTRTRVVSSDVGSLKVGIMRLREINRYGVEEVHAARLLVEQHVVSDAADNIDGETLEFLDKSLLQQAAARTDPVRFLICDREFHSAIYHASTNLLLAELVMDLYTYMMEHRRRAMSLPGAIERSHTDHRAIVEALHARDRKSVVRAFDRHLNRIYASTKMILAEADESTVAQEETVTGLSRKTVSS